MYNYHDPILRSMTDTWAKFPFRFPYLCKPRQTYKLLPFKQKKLKERKLKERKKKKKKRREGKIKEGEES
jgi:hypothetical protein